MKRIAILLLSAVSFQLSALGQGSLTPPGPPEPTFKTLQQVEPRTPITNIPVTITVPGSYYFVTNLTATSAANGIEIQAENVTVDLNGFALLGAGTGLNGVTVTGPRTNIVIRNGAVVRWTGSGVTGSTSRFRVERLTVTHNGTSGLLLGEHSIVSHCTALTNGSGIAVGSGSTVNNCVAGNNTSIGISVGFGSGVELCISTGNGGNGINLTEDGSVVHCVVRNNGGNGVRSTGNVMIAGCLSAGNTGTGMVAGANSVIRDCEVKDNLGGGISVAGDSLVIGNHCGGNGTGINDAPAIRVSSSGSRIEGNNVTLNRFGIIVESAGNIIIGNTAAKNPSAAFPERNYVFTGAQTFGPTNNLVGTGGVITNQNPWANFSY